MTGLHQHGRQGTQQGIEQHALPAAYPVGRQIKDLLHAGKAKLHHVDAEKQQTNTQQHLTGTAPARRAVALEQHAEYQQRHANLGQIDFQTYQGNQPRPRSGPQIGTEDDTDPRRQTDQPGAEKGNAKQRYKRTGLHQRGTDGTKSEAFPETIGTGSQPALQSAAGKGPEAIFQIAHAEQKQGNAGEELGHRLLLEKQQDNQHQPEGHAKRAQRRQSRAEQPTGIERISHQQPPDRGEISANVDTPGASINFSESLPAAGDRSRHGCSPGSGQRFLPPGG